MKEIIIPDSMHIVMDDLGWRNGEDDRKAGGPSRTGIARKHCAEDYKAVNKLGESLGMCISCAFVIGEWDYDNRLRSIPHLSKYGDGWNNAAFYNHKQMSECVEVINESEYIDFAVHGLLHGSYREGIDNWDTSEFYYRVNHIINMAEESEVRARLDAFFSIVRDIGITKRINTFIPPSFCYRVNEISNILTDYDIKYVSTRFTDEMKNGDSSINAVTVENGIINIDRNNNNIPWNVMSIDPLNYKLDPGIVGAHWPNILHIDPKRNFENIEKWKNYFLSRANEYGIVISEGIEFAATQSLYRRFTTVFYDGKSVVFDVSKVPSPVGRGKFFVVSTREKISENEGCNIELYQIKQNFLNYKVYPTSKMLRLA